MCIRDRGWPLAGVVLVGQQLYQSFQILRCNPLNRQLSLLDNPGLVSSDRPELRILLSLIHILPFQINAA